MFKNHAEPNNNHLLLKGVFLLNRTRLLCKLHIINNKNLLNIKILLFAVCLVSI